jgi:hypothetical protein
VDKIGHPAILDPVMMTLSKYYQEPLCLEHLDSDPDKNGVKSDHRIVVCKPISAINNKPIRNTREVKVRPFPQSGLDKLREWFMIRHGRISTRLSLPMIKQRCFRKYLLTKLMKYFLLKQEG